jgi:hypothetical protein
MALRGSLLEFELPDIFQLIANDSKTGQLVLYDKDYEAFVIFYKGMIVAAGNTAINLQSILFKYLRLVKRYSEKELDELLMLCQGEIKLFTQELVTKRYIAKEELSALAHVAIEDLACELFLWERGHYRFDALEKVDDYMIGGVSLSADAVTMEAMRRMDEWKRMRSIFGPETVFAKTKTAQQEQPVASAPFDPFVFLWTRIDGAQTVTNLTEQSFLTSYRVFETLAGLMQDNRIVPIQSKRAPVENTATIKESRSLSPAVVTGIALIAVHLLAVILIGAGLATRFTVFKQHNFGRSLYIHETTENLSQQKIRVAALYYHAYNGQPPANVAALTSSGLLHPRDVIDFSLHNRRVTE